MAKRKLSSIKYVPETDTLRVYLLQTPSIYHEVMDNVFITKKLTDDRTRTGVVIYDYKRRKDHEQIRAKLKFLDFDLIDQTI